MFLFVGGVYIVEWVRVRVSCDLFYISRFSFLMGRFVVCFGLGEVGGV